MSIAYDLDTAPRFKSDLIGHMNAVREKYIVQGVRAGVIVDRVNFLLEICVIGYLMLFAQKVILLVHRLRCRRVGKHTPPVSAKAETGQTLSAMLSARSILRMRFVMADSPFNIIFRAFFRVFRKGEKTQYYYIIKYHF